MSIVSNTAATFGFFIWSAKVMLVLSFFAEITATSSIISASITSAVRTTSPSMILSILSLTEGRGTEEHQKKSKEVSHEWEQLIKEFDGKKLKSTTK